MLAVMLDLPLPFVMHDEELIPGHCIEPKTMPDQYQEALHEYLRAKVERRAPKVTIADKGKSTPQVINIMDALKESMAKQGRAKVREAARKRMGKVAAKAETRPRSRPGPTPRRTAH
jgi:hypothetical protein